MPFNCVTGGAGFIGSHLVTALVEAASRDVNASRNAEPAVRVLDNLATGRLENLAHVADQVEFVDGDVTDSATVAAALRDVDVVYHLAALPSVPLSLERPLDVHRVCATGTLTVLDAARRAGVRRLVYAGSSSAYGQRHAGAQREEFRPQPLSPYAAAKLAGEAYCESFWHSFGFETVVLRFFNVYGERQDPAGPYAAVIPIFLNKLLRGEPLQIYGDGGQTRDFCYVGDVVQALLAAGSVPRAAGETLNVAHGRPTSLLELVERIGAAVGAEPDVRRLPARAGEIRDSLADLTRTRQILNFTPRTSLDEGLARAAAYYRRMLAE